MSDMTPMRAAIKKVATGPTQSKNLTRAEAREVMSLILAGQADPVQAAILLVALRMKRETDDENFGVLDALRAATTQASVAVPELVELTDPYDGLARYLPASPFLPALLAACGLPAVLHGCQVMGPKYGLTPHAVLAAAGLPVTLNVARAAFQVASPDCGWAYLDQAQMTPGLHALAALRDQMVKRTCLATLEKLVRPLRAERATHLVIGYVHQDYEHLLTRLAAAGEYQSALIVRGLEGGIMPVLKGRTKVRYWSPTTPDKAWENQASDLGLEHGERGVPRPGAPAYGSTDDDSPAQAPADAAALSAELGLAALRDTPGPMRDSLVYGAATLLHGLDRFPTLSAAAEHARATLRSGAAWQHWQAAQ